MIANETTQGGKIVMPAMETDNDRFGTIIKAGRELYHLTQEQLAELIGVEPRTVQRWEAEKCTPWPDFLDELSSILPGIEAQLREAIKKNLFNLI